MLKGHLYLVFSHSDVFNNYPGVWPHVFAAVFNPPYFFNYLYFVLTNFVETGISHFLNDRILTFVRPKSVCLAVGLAINQWIVTRDCLAPNRIEILRIVKAFVARVQMFVKIFLFSNVA